MRSLMLFAALLLLGVASLYQGDAQAQVADCQVQTSNPACLKHLQQPGPVLPYADLRCFNIHQSRAGIVTLNIYDERGVQINAANPQHSQMKKEYDTFCIGSHWMLKGYTFEWCTDDAGRVWSRQAVVDYHARGSAPTIELVPSTNNLPNRPAWLPQGSRT